jgi:hypothetical protein
MITHKYSKHIKSDIIMYALLDNIWNTMASVFLHVQATCILFDIPNHADGILQHRKVAHTPQACTIPYFNI